VTVPSHDEATAILLGLDPPDWLVRHSAAVAEVAAFLASAAGEQGQPLDQGLVEAAALLHDIDKAPPLAEMREALGHGMAGATWLAALGHPELAPAVANHPVARLREDDADEWLATASTEELLVAYADKRAMAELVPMSERFDDWRRRYPDSSASVELGLARALELERRACALAGVAPEQVERVRWVAA